ncbi:hypothetical protein IW146_001207 [Coemansia sp. RSA 922]|nr:hypothetical protein H4S03_003228 [Coemansia sp. S3946]KAJ2051326.1 hypothetical protein H4S04_002053 [Coemansia sp. S16]KAJ2069680.1 hypothetical protein GGI08_000224 [Coemansia sp. S2]KAJ2116842.1 hypothetical protein IW146_001207 [Coemansia sp. RSA 922]KAJ2353186.1 hypothetical protein GGH92_000822 [Coemansia sp. RSA 2673]
MSLVKYTFLVVSLALAHNSVAEMAEVGYARKTSVVAQQYMAFRPTFARGDDIHGYGQGNGSQDHGGQGNGGQDHGGQGNRDESDEDKWGNGRGDVETDVEADFETEDETLVLRDFLIASSEFEDNSATSPYGGSLVLTALLAAGSVWAAAF